MFSPVPMRQLQAVVLARDERAALRSLGELGSIHLTRADAGAALANLPDHQEAIARCGRLLARIHELALVSTDGAASPLTIDEAEAQLRQWETRVADLRQRRQAAAQRSEEAAQLSERASPYQELELPLDQVGAMEFFHFVTGSLPAGKLATLQAAVGDRVALLPLPARGDRQPVVALTSRAGRPALESALLQAGFREEKLSALPAGELERTRAEVMQVEAAWETLRAEAAPVLAAVEQAAQTERHLLEAEQQFPRTAAAVLITGWVPAAESGTVESRLGEMTGGRCVVEWRAAETLPEEQVPVLLRPPRLLRPFALLVEAFGLPRYREIEPTVFLAVSYLLMFGMMFGDVGHGAVLALAGWWAWRTGRRAGLLLVFAGCSSIGFGLVYGSCFGITALKRYALWRDPGEGDPLALMALAVGIGVVMISLGLVLNIVNRFRRGDYVGGLLDKFGVLGVVFYWGTLALVTKYAAFAARGLVKWALVLFVAVPVVGWLLKEPLAYRLRRSAGQPPEAGGLGGAIAESAVGAFEALFLFLANTISFVRLAGFAMSHAALLLAAFLLAAELQRAGGLGSLWGVLVIIAGNLVAIVLEGTIAAVQALRLEYYEFFGKFFSGEGLVYRPFCVPGPVYTP